MGLHVGTLNGNILVYVTKGKPHTPKVYANTKPKSLHNNNEKDEQTVNKVTFLHCGGLTSTVYFIQQIIAEATIIDLLYYTAAQSNQTCIHVIINK